MYIYAEKINCECMYLTHYSKAKLVKKTALISQQATLKNSRTWVEGDLYVCVLKDGKTLVEKKS
jgi:hypothetical protein